ncbi:hypothetical protein GN244_ATG12296 [Phytophthora infestans]|uniref:Uncharacterized protein n=1 Tax=Phytophthora infestans TaxID=4787 RepID=A0A833WHD9_PHYIN|nr:hypothetical protein GN244_ATG20880 [Phytophthora infestans]KAF4035632.1 hypothetical protein GN244_ATG12296 [Phytophthora infestans]KAF4134629.1 hypothetical protein GN958_ATG16176 [Phytophthora infestans]KAI9999251.1 hypothetical protein PInf_004071 [Phytophthora infestans]
MSFLLGDDYASSSDSESDEETITRQTADQEAESPAQLLPSVDSVLSSVSASTASFLPPKYGAKAQSTVKSFDLLDEEETRQRDQERQEREQENDQRRQKEASETRRMGRKRPPPPEVATKQQLAKREKKDGKERVKNQRLKGQAGIGSDFRVWKSETEMALRQQFD